MPLLTITTLVKVTTGISTTITWEIIMEENFSTLLIATMGSQDKIDSGTLVQTMGAFLPITTTTTSSTLISVRMRKVKPCPIMMRHTTMVIKK